MGEGVKNATQLCSGQLHLSSVTCDHHVILYIKWSPDGRYLLFGNTKAEIHIYDNLGNHIVSKVRTWFTDVMSFNAVE